ncbi:hypothetical protein D3C86_1699380 [compost metagenome]
MESAAHQTGAMFDDIDGLRQLGVAELAAEDVFQLDPEFVGGFPCLARQRRAYHAGIVAARLDAGHDAGGVGLVPQQIIDRIRRRHLLARFEKFVVHAGALQHAVPILIAAAAACQ